LEHDARLGIACDAVEEAARITRAAAKSGCWMTASGAGNRRSAEGVARDAAQEAALFTRAAAQSGRWSDGERSWQPPLGLRHRLRCRPKGRGGFAVAAAKSGYWTDGEWNWHRRST
jgi:hypothetical protein